MLVLVTALCLLLGIYIQQKRDQLAAIATIKSWGATIQFDYQINPLGSAGSPTWQFPRDALQPTVAKATPAGPQWLRRLLGDLFFSDVVAVNMPYHTATEIDLRELAPLKRLRKLGLSGSRIDDDDLRHLQRFGQLEEVYLADSSVTDDGLRHLARMQNLRTITLNGTTISDAGLDRLRSLNRLTNLDIFDTYVTQAGAAQLRQALPKCEITHTYRVACWGKRARPDESD